MMSLIKRMAFGAALAATPVGAETDTYGKYEAPAYVVEQALGEVEIRAYAPHILAQVAVRGDRSRALNQGFRVLAGYIFGGNTAQQSVAMTSPVAQSQNIAMTSPVAQTKADGVWTVSFMMPRAWTLETLPVPNTDAIRFVETDPARKAVLRFSGRATSAVMADREAQLRAALKAAGLTPAGPAEFYYYDDPMTLPWNRRNEVALPL